MTTGTRSRRRVDVTDLVLAGVLLLGGAVLLAAASGLPGGTQTDPLGPRGFPSLLALGFLGTGLALGLRTLLEARHPAVEGARAEGAEGAVRAGSAGETGDADEDHAHEDVADEDEGPLSVRRLLLGAAAVVAYVVALQQLGFLISTPLVLAALIAVQGGVPRRQFLLTVLGFPLAVHLLFSTLLGVPLPPGALVEGVLP